MKKPHLIIQLQRIGDLILSFPLAQKLLEIEPDRPVWIVAEEAFYSALLPLAPKVLFLPHDAHILKTTSYKTIINLSHRAEGAKLANRLEAEEYIGYRYKDNALFSHGFWQLYRHSLVSNSRYNRFHWADLNALDILNQSEMKSMKFAYPHLKNTKNKGKVGLFLGASSEFKRPDPEFFAQLAKKLIALDYKPVFLGGKAEIPLGNEAKRLSKLTSINLVNRFSLSELVFFMRELDLLITPDTGPMHIAAAYGVPSLCLSMGNVNPYETSVANPHHYVLQANTSCAPCWNCTRNYECKQKFNPAKVAFLAKSILEKSSIAFEENCLYQTARVNGLHSLQKIYPQTNTIKEKLSLFWQEYFLRIAPHKNESWQETIKGMNYLKDISANLHNKIQGEQLLLLLELQKNFKNNNSLDKDYWHKKPKIIHPLTSFIQLYLENANYSKQSYSEIFTFLEELSK